MKLKSTKAIVAAFILALLFLCGAAAVSFRSTLRMSADEKLVEHTQEVMAVIEQLVKLVSYDAVSHRGFLITGDEEFLAKHQQTIQERSAAMERLRILTAKNPWQRERLATLADVIAQRETLAKKHVELRRNEGFDAVRKTVATGRGERMLETIFSIAGEMSARERALLDKRLKLSEASAKATRWAIVSANLMAFSLVAGALWWLSCELVERRKGDTALRKSEQRFRALVTASSDVVYQMSPDWHEMMQLESRDFLAPSRPGNPDWLRDYVYPDDQPRVMAVVGESIRTKSLFQLEHRAMLVDGSVGWTFSRAVPIQNGAGEITEWFGTASNVTARKRAEQALRENEELLQFAMTTEQTGFWYVDMATHETVRSLRHDEILGYKSLQPTWRFEDFTAHIVPENREQMIRLIEDGMATGDGWDFECRINRLDGAIRWIRVSGRELSHESAPRDRKYAGIIRDITDRKQADELARENEQFKAAVLDAIPAEIALLDRSGLIIAVNESWSRFGREHGSTSIRAAGVGANYLEVATASALADDKFAGEAFTGIEAVLSGETAEFYLEYPCDTPAEKRWFLMHAVVAPGEAGGAIVAHTDITSRKNAEQALSARTAELETIMREVPVAIFIGRGGDSSFITANPAGRKMVRVETRSNVALNSPEMHYRVLRDGKEIDANELPMQQAATTAQPVLNTELEIVYPDGERRRILGNAVPLFDDVGVVTGSLGTFIDITERKAAEEALRDFNTKLTEAVVEQTVELRSTVRTLEEEIAARRRLEGEILELSEREQTRLGQDLHDNLGQQLAGIGMLSQVLSSALQKEGHPGAADAVQIARCLSESIATTRNLAKSFYPVELERGDLILALQDLALRTKLLSKVECTVSAEGAFHFEKTTEIHLYRIVQESINNALKHGKSKGIHIVCSTALDRWTMTITNDGTDYKAPEPGQDTGMGLHIFQYRAALIGAKISVGKGPHGGCMVTCSMPRVPRHPSP